MPECTWDDDKNEWLRRNRGLSFEDAVDYLEHDGLLDDILHPNQEQILGSACTSYASASMPMKFPFTATVRLNL